MDRINQYLLYDTGKEVPRLSALPDEPTVRECFFPLIQASAKLRAFVKTAGTTMRLSAKAANEIVTTIETIRKFYFEDDKGLLKTENFDMKIPSWDVSGVKRLVQNFETILAAEATEAATYTVPQRGIYSTADLIDRAIGHVPLELQSLLPDMAKDEFNAAGKCIAFELPTAAGFHALRAVESMMEKYYRAFAEPDEPKCQNWGDYIARLKRITKEREAGGPDEKTIRNLDQLRDLDRNPLMHPEDVLSMSEALVLFSNSASAMSAMAAELRARQPEPELPLPQLTDQLKIGAGTKLLMQD